MTKIFATAAAAATLLAVSFPVTPGNTQDSGSSGQQLRLAQGIDIQIGRDRDDGSRRRYNDSDSTVGIGPGGITLEPRRRDNCRTVTTTVQQDDGRMITRQVLRCD
jgi:hypothetical protein